MKTRARFLSLLVTLYLGMATIAEVTWEKVTRYNPWPTPPEAIVFGGGKFVAMTATTLAYSSDNGLTWRQAKGYATNDAVNYYRGLTKVIFANDRFVAINAAGVASVSTDGANWRANRVTSGVLQDLAYGNGRFVAVGGDSVWTSTDGVEWTLATSGRPNIQFLTYGNGKFLALTAGPGILESPDGLTWTSRPRTDPLYTVAGCQSAGCKTANGIYGLAAVDGKFAMLTWTWNLPEEGSFYSLFWSDDGASWTLASTTDLRPGGSANGIHVVNGALQPTSVAFGNGTYVIVRSVPIKTGPDLQHLTNVPSLGRVRVDSVAANGSTIVAVGLTEYVASPAPVILISRDGGKTFNEQSSAAFRKVRYLNGRFVAVGDQGAVSAMTPEGVWTPLAINTSSTLRDIDYGNGHWVAVGDEGIFSSDDGKTFVRRDSATNRFVGSVIFARGLFVAGGDYNSITTSTNGRDWQPAQTELWANGISSVAYGNGIFIAGFNRSVDGRTWTTDMSSLSGPTVFANGLFYKTGYDSFEVETSSDGHSWERSQIDPAATFRVRGLDASDGVAWISGIDTGIWRPTVSRTQLRVDAVLGGQVRVTADLPEPGRYRLEKASVVNGFFDGILNFDAGARALWTFPTDSQSAFYKVTKQ